MVIKGNMVNVGWQNATGSKKHLEKQNLLNTWEMFARLIYFLQPFMCYILLANIYFYTDLVSGSVWIGKGDVTLC